MTSPLSAYLARDHARLAAMLDEARHDPACFDQISYDAFRASLLHHMALEDRILLPLLERTGPADVARRLRPTRIEHAALTTLLALTPDADLADEVACLLHAHDRAEDAADGIHAMMDALPPSAAESALVEMRHAVRHDPAPYADPPGAPRTAQAALAAAVLQVEVAA